MYSPYSPHSPYERIYNTPDVSLPSVQEILQRIRLENVLRRSGLLPCCKAFWHSVDVTHGVYAPHQTNVEPFGASERQCTGHKHATSDKRQGKTLIRQERQEDIARQLDRKAKYPKLPHIKQKQQQPKEHEVKRHSCWISRNEPKQPCSAVTAKGYSTAKTEYDISQEFYKPFYPPKPAKLPSIQKENSTINKTKKKSKPKDISKDSVMRAELKRETKKESERWRYPEKELKRRKRQRRREQEFREWSESRENYYGKPLDFDLYDASLFDSQEKFHEANVSWKRTQDIYQDVGLTYVDLGQSTFQRHLLLPKIGSKTKGQKPKKTKTLKTKLL